jgi:hypothetical protein
MVNALILIYGIIFGVSIIALLDCLGRRKDRPSRHRGI